MSIPAAVSVEGLLEAQWLHAAQQGDVDAFGQIVRKYHRLVIDVSYRLSGDPELADDVAQDTFLRAWQQLPGFEPHHQGSLRAWLCRISRNRTIDLLRRQRPHAELDPTLPSAADRPLPAVLAHERITMVRTAVSDLPEPGRTALILREYGDLSYAEIAATLDIPIGTVMSRLHNARRRLAQELAPLLSPEAQS